MAHKLPLNEKLNPSVSLVSVVMNTKVTDMVGERKIFPVIIEGVLHYVSGNGESREVNIHEFLSRCEEYAYKRGFVLLTKRFGHSSDPEFRVDIVYPNTYKPVDGCVFPSKSKTVSIIRATEWVAKQK